MPNVKKHKNPLHEEQIGFTGAGMEFPGDYPEAPINEDRHRHRADPPKQIKGKQKAVQKELDRTKNDPTSMQ